MNAIVGDVETMLRHILGEDVQFVIRMDAQLLAVVHGIGEQSGGTIEVDSRPGAGTAFHVFLPGCGQAGSDLGSKSDAAPDPVCGHETVLIGEDEQSVREMLAFMLAERGYNVFTASVGAEALDLYRDVSRPRSSWHWRGTNWASGLSSPAWQFIQGDPLLIAVGNTGDIRVWICQPSPRNIQYQYFGQSSWGTNIWLAGANTAKRYNTSYYSGTDPTAVSHVTATAGSETTVTTVIAFGNVANNATDTETRTVGRDALRCSRCRQSHRDALDQWSIDGLPSFASTFLIRSWISSAYSIVGSGRRCGKLWQCACPAAVLWGILVGGAFCQMHSFLRLLQDGGCLAIGARWAASEVCGGGSP